MEKTDRKSKFECEKCEWEGTDEDVNYGEDEEYPEIESCPNCGSYMLYEEWI